MFHMGVVFTCGSRVVCLLIKLFLKSNDNILITRHLFRAKHEDTYISCSIRTSIILADFSGKVMLFYVITMSFCNKREMLFEQLACIAVVCFGTLFL